MTTAAIKINGSTGSDTDLPINTLVSLNNAGTGGESTYAFRTCLKCGYRGAENAFVWRQKGVVRSNICRPCEAERARVKYARPEVKEQFRVRNACPEYRTKKRAQYAARMANAEYAAKRAAHSRATYDAPAHKNNVLRSKYGITLADYVRILCAQNGSCAVCAKAPPHGRPLCVDHDHATGRVRGLLCQKCNRALGLLGDTAEAVRRALVYLEGTR